MARRSVLTGKIESEVKLLERHIRMLKAIMDHEPVGIIKLSELLGYKQHQVRYTLRILEQGKLIRPSSKGAVTTERVRPFLDGLKEVLDDLANAVRDLRNSLD
jgi:predicted transcriptional regulator